MSKSPKTKPAKTPEAEAKAEKSEAAKAKKPARATVIEEPVSEDADEPVVKPVRAKAAVDAPAAADDAAMSRRLSEMTDFQLRAHQMSTARISKDVAHAKSAAAKGTLAMIEKEMARRVATPGSAPSGTRAPVASPKMGKKRNSDD